MNDSYSHFARPKISRFQVRCEHIGVDDLIHHTLHRLFVTGVTVVQDVMDKSSEATLKPS
jgi:hypothetical protein